VAAKTAIRTRGLKRQFGDVRAVAGVDLDITDGEIYAFLGPNGAGKSTTVLMLTTLLRPSAGTAEVAGHDVVREPARVRQAIGVTLQQTALDPLMTPVELMRLQGALYRLPAREGAARGRELLERVGLADVAHRRVAALSGGMRRRLDLAMALVGRPRVLFLDEPTTGLDPTSRRAVWDEVRTLNGEGTTVFLTTQYLEEADQLADRVGFIDAGRIALEGTPLALKDQLGKPRLELTLSNGQVARARELVQRFGDHQIPRPDRLVVALDDGARAVAVVLRELDRAGVDVASVAVHEPSLDDVFFALTGTHLRAKSSS